MYICIFIYLFFKSTRLQNRKTNTKNNERYVCKKHVKKSTCFSLLSILYLYFAGWNFFLVKCVGCEREGTMSWNFAGKDLGF